MPPSKEGTKRREQRWRIKGVWAEQRARKSESEWLKLELSENIYGGSGGGAVENGEWKFAKR